MHLDHLPRFALLQRFLVGEGYYRALCLLEILLDLGFIDSQVLSHDEAPLVVWCSFLLLIRCDPAGPLQILHFLYPCCALEPVGVLLIKLELSLLVLDPQLLSGTLLRLGGLVLADVVKELSDHDVPPRGMQQGSTIARCRGKRPGPFVSYCVFIDLHGVEEQGSLNGVRSLWCYLGFLGLNIV